MVHLQSVYLALVLLSCGDYSFGGKYFTDIGWFSLVNGKSFFLIEYELTKFYKRMYCFQLSMRMPLQK